jgi:hypothetical protein
VGGGRCGLERPRRRSRIRRSGRRPRPPADDIASRLRTIDPLRLCRSDRIAPLRRRPTGPAAASRPERRRGPTPGRADRQDGRREVNARAGSDPHPDPTVFVTTLKGWATSTAPGGPPRRSPRGGRGGRGCRDRRVRHRANRTGLRRPHRSLRPVGELDAARPEPVRHLGGPRSTPVGGSGDSAAAPDDRPGRAVPPASRRDQRPRGARAATISRSPCRPASMPGRALAHGGRAR